MALADNLAIDDDYSCESDQESQEGSQEVNPKDPLEGLEKLSCPMCRSFKSYIHGKKFHLASSPPSKMKVIEGALSTTTHVVCTTCGYLLEFADRYFSSMK